MVAPGRNGVEDSPSASSSSSHMVTNHVSSSLAASTAGGPTSSPLRSLSSASGGLYVSAPGKIILFGEHAVVYGRTAIAGSIDLRTYVSLFTSADGRIYLSLPDLCVEKTWMLKDLLKTIALNPDLSTDVPNDDSPPSLELIVPIARKLSGSSEDSSGVQHLAILAFWYLLIGVVQRKRFRDQQNGDGDGTTTDGSDPPTNNGNTSQLEDPITKSVFWDLLAVKVTVRFKLPPCVGLGSSGAFCVCITTALLQTAGLIPPPSIPADEEGSLTWDDAHLDMIRKWSAAAESLIHGRASGLDAAVCTYGGVASYKPGRPIENLRNIPNLKVILVNSKVERNTTRMVQTVKERMKRSPFIVENILNTIDSISQEVASILQKADENGGVVENGGRSATLTPAFMTEMDHTNLQDLCRMNNSMLVALGVGHPKVDQICTLLARYGIHPKMTGAGGGGSVFAFLKPDTPSTIIGMIKDELAKLEYDMWQPQLGGPGVMLHPNKPEVFIAADRIHAGPVSSRSTTPAGSHQSTPAVRHKK
uniref:Mevalonate kinase n=1 Tax=Panagrellus redivivus TaxID=6233 RepID=A0A7E5A1E3_PANRE